MMIKLPVMRNVFFIEFVLMGIERYVARYRNLCGTGPLFILFSVSCILHLSCVPVPHLYVFNQTGETITVEIEFNSIVEIPCGKSAGFQFRPGAPHIKVIRGGATSFYRIPWEPPPEYRHFISKDKDARVNLGILVNADGRIYLLRNGQKLLSGNEGQPRGFPVSPAAYKESPPSSSGIRENACSGCVDRVGGETK